ncbi:MAG: hypothetical protein OEZ39_13165 [Gammaproteobacteria bacterium]|nr:hypothetical protein [Gammaproteobacteria bacterium]MDH5652799.1 hypothetical protein [Gammaproteobacteria bacterium]
MPNSLPALFCTLILYVLCPTVQSQPADVSSAITPSTRLDGYKLIPGSSTKQLTFTVKNAADNKKAGALTEEMQHSPNIILASPYRYFSDEPNSNSGWYIEYAFSTFSVSRQELGEDNSGNLLDMGTRVSGEYLYMTPVFFYEFLPGGDTARKNESLKMGAGVGIGYQRIKGDIYLTEQLPVRRLNVDINKPGYAISVFFEYTINNYMLRARGNTPITTHGETQFNVYEFGLDIGYVISL